MRFTVPQFIEIEDKIFGPLTWKQFLYVGGGFGMSAVLFLTAPFIIFLLFGLPIALLAAALAFYPINNRPFSVFLESMFNYFTGQREYYWRQTGTDQVYAKKTARTDDAAASKEKSVGGGKVASLARRLELEALQKDDS